MFRRNHLFIFATCQNGVFQKREATYHSFLHVGVQSANDRKTAARREFTLHVLEDVSTCSSPATPCKTGTIRRKPGKTKIDEHVKAIVDQQMRVDDETTIYQLHKLLCTQKYRINRRTILRCRSSLGWTLRGSAHCQLIRNINKQKRLAWAQQNANDTFDDVIWTDECTVQLDCHRLFCCRKRGEAPRLKPR